MHSGGRKYSLNFNFSSLVGSSSGSINPNQQNNNLQTNSENQNEQRNRSAQSSGQNSPSHNRRDIETSSMTDELEINASQQVISLLQRQLEQLRVEKNSLEKLLLDNLSSSSSHGSKNFDTINENFDAITFEAESKERENKETTHVCDVNCENKMRNLLNGEIYTRDEQIVKLKAQLREIDCERQQLSEQLKEAKGKIFHLENQNGMLSEMLQLRDETVVSLTNELYDTTSTASTSSTSSSRRQSSAGEIKSSSKQIYNRFNNSHQKHSDLFGVSVKRLQSKVTASEANETCNLKLIQQLTKDCRDAEKREIDLRSQNQELEAKCCQIQSKLLSLLKEIEQSSSQSNTKSTGQSGEKNSDLSQNESVKFLIKRLLEDKSLDIPLSWKEGNRRLHSNSNSDDDVKAIKQNKTKYVCDELGFYLATQQQEGTKNTAHEKNNLPTISENSETCWLNEIDEVTQNSQKAADFVIIDPSESNSNDKSTNSTFETNSEREKKTRQRWDMFVKNFDKHDLTKSKEFRSLLRLGCPQEYRCKIWRALINLRVGHLRESEYGPDYYQHLLNRPQTSSTANVQDPSVKQIELDLLRTLPNNRHFETLDSSGTIRLKRVLTAYSYHNPSIGYCQGMNRIAAVALLSLPEEEAFWCLVAIIEDIMPKGYYSDLWLAQIDSFVVSEFVGIKMPTLSQHLERHGIELSLFAWFLTIFVDGLHPDIFLRCWDCFLYEGDKVLFRLALALVKINETRIMKMTNSASVNSFLRSLVDHKMDVNYLFELAFNWTNPLSSKSLQQKRMNHYTSVKAELDAMDRHQRNYASNSPNQVSPNHIVPLPIAEQDEANQELPHIDIENRDQFSLKKSNSDSFNPSRYDSSDSDNIATNDTLAQHEQQAQNSKFCNSDGSNNLINI